MKVVLKNINSDKIVDLLKLVNEYPLVIQYADFNVLNYLYKNNYEANELNNIYLYPDSTLVYLYVKYFIDKNFQKIVSTDLQNELLNKFNATTVNIFLFGDSESILSTTIKNIKKQYSKISIVGYVEGYHYDNEKIITKINDSDAEILFVGLGVGRQEKWIVENYHRLKVKVIISVGGWFQYLAENKRRAPIFLRKIHLEWLHKLVVEFPRVWKRYLIGIPKFIYRIITKKIIINLDEK